MERIGNVLRTVLPPILRGTTCPHCGVEGTIELFDEPANGGLGLRCTACQVRRPWQELPQWLPQFSRRRPNPIRSLVQGNQPRCYLCGDLEDQDAERSLPHSDGCALLRCQSVPSFSAHAISKS